MPLQTMILSKGQSLSHLALGLAALTWPAGVGFADVAVLEPSQDTAIFEESDNSSGAGDLFSGRTQSDNRRRALIKFDMAGDLPLGLTLNSASLTLQLKQSSTGERSADIHRMRGDWGEGASSSPAIGGQGAPAEASDATWLNPFYPDTLWFVPGGDYVEGEISVTQTVNGPGAYTWSSPQFLEDVRRWYEHPLENFGWMLIIDESQHSAKRFHSREAADPANRPKLIIDFTTYSDEWLALHFPGDPQNAADHLDLDGDSLPNFLEYALGTDPRAFTLLSQRPRSIGISPGIGVQGNFFSYEFTRHPRASDLSLRLEVSDDVSDPASWISLAESQGGQDMTGGNVVLDFSLSGNGVNTVIVRDSLDAGTLGKRFMRLSVTRN